jgi:hypothetical protein
MTDPAHLICPAGMVVWNLGSTCNSCLVAEQALIPPFQRMGNERNALRSNNCRNEQPDDESGECKSEAVKKGLFHGCFAPLLMD